MAKKPNAANIAKGLAQLGGGSKKEGGGGMLQGIVNIFTAGVAYGEKVTLDSKQQQKNIDISNILLLGDKTKKK